MGAGGEVVGVPRDLIDGGSAFDSPALVVNLPSSMQLAVSHQTLCISKHFPTKVAFVVLLPRVDGQVFREVKRLTEHFPTYFTGMRLFSCVDTVVTSQRLSPPEAFSTNMATIWPL